MFNSIFRGLYNTAPFISTRGLSSCRFFWGGVFWRSFANQFLGVPSCYHRDLEKGTSIRSDQIHLIACYLWWFWNPANQLMLVRYPIVYRVFYIPGGCLGFLNHQLYLRKATSYIIAWNFFHFVEGLAGLPALKSDEGPGLSFTISAFREHTSSSPTSFWGHMRLLHCVLPSAKWTW